MAKEFGVPVQLQRFWIWAKRQNHTYRPNRPLLPHEELQTVVILFLFYNYFHAYGLPLSYGIINVMYILDVQHIKTVTDLFPSIIICSNITSWDYSYISCGALLAAMPRYLLILTN